MNNMEKYSMEKAYEEAFEIKNKADKAMMQYTNGYDDLAALDYDNAENSVDNEREGLGVVIENLINKHEKEIRGASFHTGPKIFEKTLRSIYDNDTAEELSYELMSQSGVDSLAKQIFEEKPEIVFLCMRSAVPAGYIYKAFVDEIKNKAILEGDGTVIEACKKIPQPKFLLTNEIDKWEKGDNNITFKNAVRIYEGKLMKMKFLGERDKEHPFKIGVFDESKNTGIGLKKQVKAISEACKNILLEAEVLQFDYADGIGGLPADVPPVIPLPISGHSKGERGLPSLEIEKLDPELGRLYHQQAIRLSKRAAKLMLKFSLINRKWDNATEKYHNNKKSIANLLSEIGIINR